MAYSTFLQSKHNVLKEPMFFGKNVNVSRYDQQKYPIFEKLIEKQLSFFWRPEEVDISKDRKDFHDLLDHEQHIFLSNLKYQTLLDSVQGRSPNVAFLPIVSLPELETWIETWSFSETIHSRSYTHIIRSILPQPSAVFDDILNNKDIIKRAETVTKHYDDFINLVSHYYVLGEGNHIVGNDNIKIDLNELKEKLYLTMVSVNILEAIRFYVSFACSFAFAERSIMEGNAKIIKLIARDEALHLAGTQQILNMWSNGNDDPQMKEIAKKCRAQVYTLFEEAADQEKDWAKFLFKDGSMIGLNAEILGQYVEYITDVRLRAIGLKAIYGTKSNPLPWMNSWISSDNVQVAPQEAEISSYLVGQIDSNVSSSDFEGFTL